VQAREAVSHLRTLGAVLARLPDRGYPAPRFHAVGHAPEMVFWVQQRLRGFAVDRGRERPDRAVLARLLPELFRLNGAQVGYEPGNGSVNPGHASWPGHESHSDSAGSLQTGEPGSLAVQGKRGPGTRAKPDIA